MKILHLIYTHGVAGAEKYLLDLLPGLKQYGIQCDVICVCPHAHQSKVQLYCNRLTEKGIATQLLPTSRINLLGVAKKINHYCQTNGIRIIHSHLFNSDVLAVAVKLFFNKKILLLSTKHGYKESYFIDNADSIGKINYNLYYFVTKFVIGRIDKNITISKAVADLYYNLKLTPQKMYFIHHGISVDKKIIKEKGVQYRVSTPQLIIAGRLTEIKGHAYLFDAMPEIIKAFPAMQLLVMGEGIEQEALEKKAAALGVQKHISFTGFQNNPYSYIEESDIIVLPSLYEPFGLVYIESFALKTPVIAFDVQACNEIIVHNENGILVPVKDSKRLASSIISLLHNPVERERLADNGYEKYVSYYNTERMIKDTAVFYKKIQQEGMLY